MSDDKVFIKPVKTKRDGERCPKCGKSAEGGTAFDTDQPPQRDPEPGDFALCVYCGEMNAYDDKMHLRPVTDQERELLRRDPRLAKVLGYAQLAAKKTRRQWQ